MAQHGGKRLAPTLFHPSRLCAHIQPSTTPRHHAPMASMLSHREPAAPRGAPSAAVMGRSKSYSAPPSTQTTRLASALWLSRRLLAACKAAPFDPTSAPRHYSKSNSSCNNFTTFLLTYFLNNLKSSCFTFISLTIVSISSSSISFETPLKISGISSVVTLPCSS